MALTEKDYLDPATAQRIIDNFKTHIQDYAEKFGQGEIGGKAKEKKRNYPDGIAQSVFAKLDDVINEYGTDVVGSAINILSPKWKKVFEDPSMYYVAREQSGVDEKQERTLKDFSDALNDAIDQINELLSGENEEEPIGETGGPGGSGGSGGGETEGIPAGGKYDDLPKSMRTIVYRKLRDNLLALVRRRLGFGLDLRYLVPSIPKNITSGSIRNLEKIISKVKTDYRYLDKTRGYRGRSR